MTDTQTSSVVLPNEVDKHVAQHDQYGMRFPDGSIQWDSMPYKLGRISFDALVKTRKTSGTNQDWTQYLNTKAAEAKIDPEQYAKSHQLIRRSVIVAITEAEDTYPLWDLAERGVVRDGGDDLAGLKTWDL